MANVNDELNSLIAKTEKVKKEIQQRINDLPDNPRITRLSKNTYVLKSSDLGDNWSAEYHDFKHTYRILGLWIDSMNLSKILPNLREALEKGWFIYQNTKYRLHPDIINHLKSLLYG